MTLATEPVVLAEWESRSPTDCPALAGLSLEATHEARRVAEALSRSGMLDIVEAWDGIHLTASSYVGSLRLGDLRVLIRPKIAMNSVLSLLRYACGYRALDHLPESEASLSLLGLEDLIVAQLIAEVAELVGRGLRRSYVRAAGYLESPQGRIDVQRIARDGGVMAPSVPCCYYPRSEDNPLNRALLTGLRVGARVAASPLLKARARRLASSFGDRVSDVALDRGALHRLRLSMDRLARAYQTALHLAELLCAGTRVDLDRAEASPEVPGFLLDMNHLFQTVLCRFLRDNLGSWSVRDEQARAGLLRYAPGHNPRGRASPSLRPDFLILEAGRVAAVLDAKYRDLWARNLPPHMLYQLAVYASTDRTGVATIVYPTPDASAVEQRIEVRAPGSDRLVGEVRLRPVVMAILEGHLATRESAQAARDRRAYARWLAFGS